ncbi:hypothetical protein APM_3480 [Acidiphilium sp. PM]|nr:hypothetical protein APM_3480 [Acidiphilium sp. PM]
MAVHPRACGEHMARSQLRENQTGSSPRLRGTLWEYAFFVLLIRFIPAPAGNTRSHLWHTSRATVHPRACGEHKAGG